MPATHPQKSARSGRASAETSARSDIDIKLGNNAVFADAARHVFQTMVGAELRIADYEIVTRLGGRGLAVMIALNGPVPGTLIVCISHQAARSFVAALTGLEAAEISDGVMVDGVSELVNMIAGAAKATLDDTDMRFEMTLPVSCAGDQVGITLKAGMPGGVMQCSWANESFQLGIWRMKDG